MPGIVTDMSAQLPDPFAGMGDTQGAGGAFNQDYMDPNDGFEANFDMGNAGQEVVPQNQQQQPQQPNLQPQRRGPAPAIPGVTGNTNQQVADDFANFWDEVQPGQQQQLNTNPTPNPTQTNGIAPEQAEFYRTMLQQMQVNNQSTQTLAQKQAEDARQQQWKEYLDGRKIGLSKEELVAALAKAGSDSNAQIEVIHSAVQRASYDVYSKVAEELQGVMQNMITAMVPQIIQAQMKTITTEQQFNSAFAAFCSRNPQFANSAIRPIALQAYKQAHMRSNGNTPEADRTAALYLGRFLRGGRGPNNNGNNSQSPMSINWSQHAKGVI